MRVPTNRVVLCAMVIVLALSFQAAASPAPRPGKTAVDGGATRRHNVGRTPKPSAGPKSPRGYVPYKRSEKKRGGGSVAAVVAAYVLAWVILILYLLRLHQRQKRLETELDGLNRRLGRHEDRPDPNGDQRPGGDP